MTFEPDYLPHLNGGPLGRVRFKSVPEDFVVEEVLGFEPSGVGEHCLVWAEKRDLDSNTAAARLADALGLRHRLVSHCGLKDHHDQCWIDMSKALPVPLWSRCNAFAYHVQSRCVAAILLQYWFHACQWATVRSV